MVRAGAYHSVAIAGKDGHRNRHSGEWLLSWTRSLSTVNGKSSTNI